MGQLFFEEQLAVDFLTWSFFLLKLIEIKRSSGLQMQLLQCTLSFGQVYACDLGTICFFCFQYRQYAEI